MAIDMGFSKEWIILICIVSIISSVIAIVIPKSSAAKLFGYLSAAVLVYSFLLPLISSKGELPDFSRIVNEKSGVSAEFDSSAWQTALYAAQSGYETAFMNELKDKNLVISDIKVNCSVHNDEIAIENVIVYGNFNESQKKEAEQIIESLAENNIKIIFQEG